MIGRLLAPVLLAVLLLGTAAAPASAHASLVATDPADGEVLDEAPAAVTLTFDESVSVPADGVQAFDAAGQPVDADAAARDEVVTVELPDDLDDGTYVVTWRVVSADGHPIAGSLTFHIGAPSETVVAPTSVATDAGPLRTIASLVQAASYVALLLAGGLVVFLGWTLRGVRVQERVRRRLLLVLRAAAAGAVLFAAAAVAVSGAYQRGAGPGGILAPASFDLDLVRNDLTVLVLQAVGLGLACLHTGRSGSSLIGDLGAAIAVWSPALVGHTRAYEPVTLLVVTDALHLSAGAVWLGGLVGLTLALPSLAGRERDGALLLTRFSTTAGAVLAVLVAAGVLLGWRILGSWSGLVETTYGRLLMVKIGLALVAVGIAAWNRFRLLPRVRDGGHETRRRATHAVRRAVRVEASVLVAVLAVTGFLVEQPPRDETAAAPAASSVPVAVGTAGDHRVLVLLDPGAGRRRTLSVQIQDDTGEPVDLAAPPTVALRSEAVDLGVVPVAPTAAGTYRAEVTFPSTGRWEVQVRLPVSEFETPVTTVTVDVE